MVHQYKCNGYNIVIDGNSGTIHWVDDITYQVIEAYETGEFPPMADGELKAILEEIEQLKKEGKLFSEDKYQKHAENLKKRHGTLKAICLNVAHTCNMDCVYCFAGKGEYKGNSGLMSIETAKKAIDFLVGNSPGRKNLEVDFFGGEPLLNWQMIKETVAYGRKIPNKNFRFTLTTNGLLIDRDVIEFANREMDNVVLSLDGSKDVNDAMRRTKAGQGTYNMVISKFKELVSARGDKEYYIRGTYTSQNLDFAKEIIYLAEEGFRSLAMEPVVAEDNVSYGIKSEDLEKIFKQYEILAEEMIKCREDGKGFTFYHYMIDFQGGPCISKRLSGCGVGQEYVAITPEGDIYPCHQFASDKKFIMGNLHEQGEHASHKWNPGKIGQLFATCHVYGREECANCFAKLYCSGGCAANGYHATGKIQGLYDIGCQLHKKRLECAIMMSIHEKAMEGARE